MTPEERFEALAGVAGDEIEGLADRVLALGPDIEMVRGPEAGSAALRLAVPGTRTSTAVIGHAAVTTCAVRLAGVRGDGCRPGRDLTGALAAAICDAEAERSGPLAAEVITLAARSMDVRGRHLRDRARRTALTRLDRS